MLKFLKLLPYLLIVFLFFRISYLNKQNIRLKNKTATLEENLKKKTIIYKDKIIFKEREVTGTNIKQETYGKSVFDIGEKENRERFFYQYNLSDKESDGNYRLIEYSIDSSGTDWDCFKLTNVDITETGERIEHEKYCDTCQNNTKPSYEGEYPRLIHEKSKDYPD